MRDMFQNYWPWRNKCEKPRGFRNVECDDMYPADYQKVFILI